MNGTARKSVVELARDYYDSQDAWMDAMLALYDRINDTSVVVVVNDEDIQSLLNAFHRVRTAHHDVLSSQSDYIHAMYCGS
jgi:uncharacterized protein HemX